MYLDYFGSLPLGLVYFFHIPGEKTTDTESSVIKGSPHRISNQGT